MRETIPFGGHHIFDLLVASRLQRFYDRLAARRPEARQVLDIGCGPGHLAHAIARSHPEAQVIGIDLDPVQVRLARRQEAANLSFEQGASHAIPLEDGSRDWILATETFHHWSQPAPSLEEIYRVLAPGGVCWIVEAAGDMTRAELEAWTGKRPWPGLLWWVRLIFKTHGYTPERLHGEVVPLADASPFGGATVTREDGWWIVELTKPEQGTQPPR